MALRHSEFTGAGAVVAAIDVDDPGRHAAMVEKLNLPFPMLSDPDRSLSIAPFDLVDEDDRRDLAIPATIVIGPDGAEIWRSVSRDYADRPVEDEALDVVKALWLDPVSQPAPTPGEPDPSPTAMPFTDMRSYFRGAKGAALAMARRFPDSKVEAQRYAELMDRYMEDVTAMYRIKRAAAEAG